MLAGGRCPRFSTAAAPGASPQHAEGSGLSSVSLVLALLVAVNEWPSGLALHLFLGTSQPLRVLTGSRAGLVCIQLFVWETLCPMSLLLAIVHRLLTACHQTPCAP